MAEGQGRKVEMTDREYVEELNVIKTLVIEGKIAAEAGRLAWNLLENIRSMEFTIKKESNDST